MRPVRGSRQDPIVPSAAVPIRANCFCQRTLAMSGSDGRYMLEDKPEKSPAIPTVMTTNHFIRFENTCHGGSVSSGLSCDDALVSSFRVVNLGAAPSCRWLSIVSGFAIERSCNSRDYCVIVNKDTNKWVPCTALKRKIHHCFLTRRRSGQEKFR